MTPFLLIGAVHLDRLFVLTFSPILGVIVAVLLWRAWREINKGQG